MKNLNFFFSFFLIFISCNQPQRVYAQGCSFDLNVVSNECGEALLRVENCSDCSSYNWNTGATSRSLVVTQSGTYRVTVTSFTNQCTSVAQVSVQVEPPCNQGCSFNISETKNCGQTTLEVTDCPDCFAYIWSNGATTKSVSVSQSGTYTVTVTGGGGACTSKASKNVEIANGPSVSISGNTFFCEGSSTTLLAESSSIVEYCWSTGAKSPGLLVTQPGTYTVTVTSIVTGCTATASKEVVMVHSPQTPTISAEVQGDKVVLTAFPPAAGYIWSNGATGPSVTVNSSMTLSVRVKNHEGCTSEESCPVPVMVLVKEVNTGGNGSDPANCNKNGIVTSNGMSYGAVIKKPNSQLFLYAPPGANQYSCTWNQGQTGGNKGWVLANSNVGTHYYLLQCKFYGSDDWHWFCFQYTIVNNLDYDDDVESRSVYSSEEIFIPEEYRQEIEEFLNQKNSSSYENNERVEMKVSPNPTYGPIRIEAEMEIPVEQPSGIYILQMFDVNGRPVGEPKKVIKN